METFSAKQERKPDWYTHAAWYEETTRGEDFKSWFKDSVVVDTAHNPLPMFHFTPMEFKDFDIRYGDLGLHFGSLAATDDRIDELKRNNDIQSGQRILPVFLNVKNPLRTDDLLFFSAPPSMEKVRRVAADSSFEHLVNGLRKKLGIMPSYSVESMARVREILKGKGYDGLVYANKHEDKGADSYMVLDEQQIWYALSNEPAIKPDYSKHKVSLEPESDMNFDIPQLNHD